MVSGGFYPKRSDLLLEVDPLDYEVALEQARASLASAKSELIQRQKKAPRATAGPGQATSIGQPVAAG